ncbi:hypothetical protein BJ165DRAFT_1593516 [Panaeolus papilionaceus]|nr:hypothetical protein BJ165DRAFT_1593516 [Panaeolus papilionaceus]
MTSQASTRSRGLEEEKLRKRAEHQAVKQAQQQNLIEPGGRESRHARQAAMKNKAWMSDASAKQRRQMEQHVQEPIIDDINGQLSATAAHPRERVQKQVQERDDDDDEEERAPKRSKGKFKSIKTNTPQFSSDDEDEDAFRNTNNTTGLEQDSEDEDDNTTFSDRDYRDHTEDQDADFSEDEDNEDIEMRPLARRKATSTDVESIFDDNVNVEVVPRCASCSQSTLNADKDDHTESDIKVLKTVQKSKTHHKDTAGAKALADERAIVLRSTPAAQTASRRRRNLNHNKQHQTTAPSTKTPSHPLTPPTDIDDGDNDSSDITVTPTANEARWDVNTRIQPGKIKVQNTFIRAVIREAIRSAEITMLMDEPWAELLHNTEYKQQVLGEGVAKCMSQNVPVFKKIEEHIRSDTDFTNLVGTWILDWISGYRNKAYLAACKDGLQPFRLGTGAECVERVLTVRDNHLYVYLGTWGSVEVERTADFLGEGTTREKPVWIPERYKTIGGKKRLQAYLHESIAGAITAGFFPLSKAWGFKHKGVFTSSDKTQPDELELTIPVVAFGATAVFAAIFKWHDGKPAKTERFIGDLFQSVYNHHVTYLKDLQTRIPNNFHFIMHSLYKTTSASGQSHQLNNNNQLGPLAGVDMDGLD